MLRQRRIPSIALAALLCLGAASASAQFPAGTPRDDTGSRPSQMGNPTPQEEMKTYRNEKGELIIEDGRKVKGMQSKDSVPNRNMQRIEDDTTSEDPPHRSATPGELE
jgi:hypothetical protein